MKVLFFFLFKWIILYPKVIKGNVLTIPLSTRFWNSLGFKVRFTKENDRDDYYFTLNTYLPFSLSRFDLNKIPQNTRRGKEIISWRDDYEMYLYIAEIEISKQIKIDNLMAYNYDGNKYILSWYSGLSFGYHYKNESFSIIHYFYNTHQIEHKQFAIHRPSIDVGNLYIGGVPNNEHLSLPYKGVIQINEALPTWGFTFKAIQYRNKEYKIDLPCIIITGLDKVFMSKEIFDIMKDKVFKEEIDNKTCNISEYKQSLPYNYLYCNNSIHFKDIIEFVLSSNSFHFPINELFIEDVLDIQSYNENPINNFTGVIIGSKFINLFNYSLFDYDNNQIEFYSNTFPITIIANSTKLILAYLNITICFCNGILLLFIQKLI